MKGLACVAIVWHHLAFYGPMSDAAQSLAPGLIDALFDQGRMAVQVFLVVAGFLTAQSLAPGQVLLPADPARLLLRRYGRLVPPYLVALLACMAVAALLRPWFSHPSLPEAPTVVQLLAHVLLLQDLLDHDALSAGVWYVAIDFQLFALAVACLAVARRWPGRLGAWIAIGLVAALTAVSLFAFNRDAWWDESALYFFGAYGLGMLACWAAGARRPAGWLAVVALLGLGALAVDYRGRIALALATAVLLAWAGRPRPNVVACPRWVRAWGAISYAVFLVHFPVCLAVNAVVDRFWHGEPVPNAWGMMVAFVLSMAAGKLFHTHVEQPLAGRRPADRDTRWQ